MVTYESIFILRPDLDEETVTKACDRINTLVSANEGAILSVEKMGHRRLAYEVKGFEDGYYVVLNFDGRPETTRELERNFRISDEVIRYLIVQKKFVARPAQAKKAEAGSETPATEDQTAASVAETASLTSAEAPPEAAAEAGSTAKPGTTEGEGE